MLTHNYVCVYIMPTFMMHACRIFVCPEGGSLDYVISQYDKRSSLISVVCLIPGENVGENTRTICENYALFSRAISSDRAHFSPFRRLFSRISRARAVTRAIR